MPTRALSLATVIGSDGALNLADVAGLHTVAGTGSYTDLINKPTIPSDALTFTGDASGSGTTGTSTSLTLANSGVSAGSYGSATDIPAITVDSKGRITSVTNTAVSIPSGSLTFTGDVTGSGTTGSSTSLTLASVGIAGTYTKIITDAKGRVTSGTTLASSDLPTYTGTITSSQVTTALGYTPYRAVTVEGAATAPTNGLDAALQGWTAFDGYGAVVPNYPNNQWWVGAWTGGNSTRGVQLAGGYADSELYFRKGQDGWQSWKRIWHAGNLTNLNQLTNGPGYITGYTETDTLATVTARGTSTSTSVQLTSAGNHYNGHFYYDAYAADGSHYPHFLDGSNASGSKVNWRLFTGGTNSHTHYWGTDTALFATKLESTSRVDAPIFYDRNDTNYYLDPNSTGTSLQIAGTIEQGNNYAHPNIEWSAAGTSTGEVIFYLPGTTSNYGMVHMVFDIYEYNSPRLCTVIVGGHNWNTTWYNTACNVVGYTDKQVRLGVKDGRFVVVFGTTGSSWSYGQIRLRKIQNGSYYNNIMDLGGNWSATQTTTESFSTITSDLRGFRTPSTMEVDGIIYGYSNIRSPIFYDYNDTGYYIDPNSTSDSALRIRGGALHGPNPTWGTYLLVGGDGRQNYTNSTTTASVCSTNGNLHLDAASGYETYINYYDGSNVYFGSGGSSIVAQISSDGTFRSPVFYDYNNTAYYADLHSTGDSIRAAGNIVAYYSDDRLKTKLGNITDALKKVNQLNGFYYQANELAQNLGYKPTMEVGVSAQEVELVLPQIVKPAPIDQQYKTVDYSRLVPLLIEAVKELSQKLSKLEAKYGITS